MTQGDDASAQPGPNRAGPNNGPASTGPEAIEDQFRAAEAVAMRRAGQPLREVVETLGYYDTRTASRAIKRYLHAYGREDAEAYRDLQIDRLEWMWRTLVPVFESGGKDGTVSTWAADRLLAVHKELTLLTGADKVPVEPEPDGDGQVAPSASGRTLAQLVGGDPEKARRVARALHEAGVFERPRSDAVIEHQPDGPGGGE